MTFIDGGEIDGVDDVISEVESDGSEVLRVADDPSAAPKETR